MNRNPNINSLTGQYPYNRRGNQAFNIDEYQKQEIYRQGGGDVLYQTAVNNAAAYSDSAASQPVGFLDTSVFFDTAYLTVPSNLSAGELIFNITAVNDGRDIPNIIEAAIAPFYFQVPLQSSTQPNFFFYRRVYLNIVGLPAAQSVRAANGNLYQFEFEVININSIAVQLVPLHPAFYLQSILSSLNEVQMHFSVGPDFTPIPLLKTTILVENVNAVPFGLPATSLVFQILNGDLTSLLYDYPLPIPALPVYFVPPSPGVAVFFKNFNPLLPLANINSPQGVYVTRIINSTTFEVGGFDATGIAFGTQSLMVIGKNRTCMNLRFTSVANKTTNYVVVSKS